MLINMSAEFVKQMTDVLVAVLSMLDEAGYDTTDIEIELNEICSDYVDDAGNGFAEFRRMLDEEHGTEDRSKFVTKTGGIENV